ncbi:hypothetical protein T08_384 [Trichinella sp. T8]|nr:hypothetical protein T08_384 [Trichinella sp. T8]
MESFNKQFSSRLHDYSLYTKVMGQRTCRSGRRTLTICHHVDCNRILSVRLQKHSKLFLENGSQFLTYDSGRLRNFDNDSKDHNRPGGQIWTKQLHGNEINGSSLTAAFRPSNIFMAAYTCPKPPVPHKPCIYHFLPIVEP